MKQPHMQVAQVLMKGAGFYSWCLRENSLTADKAFAQIYEIDEGELARGVPVEFILERIVEEDRPRLAARIHEVILGVNHSSRRIQSSVPADVENLF